MTQRYRSVRGKLNLPEQLGWWATSIERRQEHEQRCVLNNESEWIRMKGYCWIYGHLWSMVDHFVRDYIHPVVYYWRTTLNPTFSCRCSKGLLPPGADLLQLQSVRSLWNCEMIHIKAINPNLGLQEMPLPIWFLSDALLFLLANHCSRTLWFKSNW